MEELTNEQIQTLTETAEAERVTGGEKEGISLGNKFKDVNALLSAYNSLQAEFTKRCQRLKELETKMAGDKTEVPSVEIKEEPNIKNITDEDKNNVLREYLKSVVSSKGTAKLLDSVGVGVKTPTNKPKTIKEAGMLAKEIF